MLAVGDIAPATEMATDTDRFSLAPHDGKKMVIFFFPRADTSGCTKESIQFSDLIEDFAAAGTEVIGISKDTPQKQAKFRAKYDLKCHLGADHGTDICEQFGVWVEKSMYGRTYMGIQRATFVIDANGKIAAVWSKVKVDGHAAEVLAFVKTI
jgi:peroxiredoxin Q/BCP